MDINESQCMIFELSSRKNKYSLYLKSAKKSNEEFLYIKIIHEQPEGKHKYFVHSLETYFIKTFKDTEVRKSNNLNFIPCWSLAALLGVMPKDKSIDCAISFGYYNGKGEYIEKWICSFEKEGETTDDFIIETTDGDNAIDACVAMIEKLHELKML